MPISLQVIRANEFVCLDADEHLDMEASRRGAPGFWRMLVASVD